MTSHSAATEAVRLQTVKLHGFTAPVQVVGPCGMQAAGGSSLIFQAGLLNLIWAGSGSLLALWLPTFV